MAKCVNEECDSASGGCILMSGKTDKVLKAELVNALYEQTINGEVTWEDLGEIDNSRVSSMACYMKERYTHHGWEYKGKKFIFLLKKSLTSVSEDNLNISIINGASSRIYKGKIGDVFLINPIEALIAYLEKGEETHLNVCLEKMAERIKNNDI